MKPALIPLEPQPRTCTIWYTQCPRIGRPAIIEFHLTDKTRKVNSKVNMNRNVSIFPHTVSLQPRYLGGSIGLMNVNPEILQAKHNHKEQSFDVEALCS